MFENSIQAAGNPASKRAAANHRGELAIIGHQIGFFFLKTFFVPVLVKIRFLSVGFTKIYLN